MSRTIRPALLVALVAALVTGGCGIPDNGDVVPVGPGPSRGASSADDVTPTKFQRTDTTEPATFVVNYLAAAAGDYDSATDYAKQFMSPRAAASFKASTDIKVIRVANTPLVNPNNPVVEIKGRLIGTLGNFGILTPSAGQDVSYEITVDTLEGQPGLFVTKAPATLLLSERALSAFYTKRTIYFWNLDHTGLVPDVRYMPLSVPFEQQPTEVLDWLTNGPAPWLDAVAEPLPANTKPIGNVPAASDTLQISLSGQALPADDTKGALDRLQKQLRWSLRPNLPAALELTVDKVGNVYRGNDYLASNAAYRPTNETERFVVYDGQVRRLAESANAAAAVPVLQPAANRNVRYAAFSASANRTYAALVVNVGASGQGLRVGSAPNGEQATLRQVALPKPIGRPVWAVSPPVGTADGTVGLVVAMDRLYSFSPDSSSAERISLPGGLRAVSAVAIAQDGRRVALLSGGRLYLTTLSHETGLELSEPVAIDTVIKDLSEVDWSGEGTLVVAGVNAVTLRIAIGDVSIDGAAQTDRLGDIGSNKVTYLTAHPASPSLSQDTGVPVAYVLDGDAFDESSSSVPIDVRRLAQPVSNPRAGVQPTAPFFLH